MSQKLYDPVFTQVPLTQIRPGGWLLNQLNIQANGLSGMLDKFWPDIKDSKWVGGEAEGWERVPYWLDGFIPLAWLLDDEDMKRRASNYIDYIISCQEEDGWICPVEREKRMEYDIWAFFLILKVLVVYYDATGDDRMEEVVRKGLLSIDRHIDRHTLFNWGHTRWFECLIPIWWLYERTGEEWLLELAVKLMSQGFDWIELFKRWPYTRPVQRRRWSFMNHVVNNAMMLKSGALTWRLTGLQEHLDSAEQMVRLLDEYHGMVTGVFTGDECLAGTSPVQGTELCAVVEYMYSLEHLISITGKAHWGDRLEKIAYNALPATFTPDMLRHQYDQQVNQVECSKQPYPVFLTNGGESNIFGIEPNYGCCTANLSQGWPKFCASVFMKSSDGLAVPVYAPCTVNTAINGVNVSVTMDTGYPFRETVNFKVRVDGESSFALHLRVPEWAGGACLKLRKAAGGCEGSEECSIPLKSGGFYRHEQVWKGVTSFTLHFPMRPQIVSRPNNLYAITRGPLVYSLPVEKRVVEIKRETLQYEPPYNDYELYPASPWNYGLCLDKEKAGLGIRFEEHPIGDCPFSPGGAPVVAYVRGKKVEWDKVNGAAAPVPNMDSVAGEEEDLKLIPYGCTNLRMTEMPLLK
ncbi:MAG: hypothetical protein GX754_10450 [Clostridiaceae bacterium]|nr:hypothetical protein [Clostridiaceae bacterium]